MDHNGIYEIKESITEAQCAIEQGQTIMDALTQTAYEHDPDDVFVADDPLEVQGVSPEAEQYARKYKMAKGLLCLVNKSLYECENALDGLDERLDSIGRDENGQYFCSLDPLEDNNFDETLDDIDACLHGSERLLEHGYPLCIMDAQEQVISALNALCVPSSERERFDELVHAIRALVTTTEEHAEYYGYLKALNDHGLECETHTASTTAEMAEMIASNEETDRKALERIEQRRAKEKQ